MAARKSLEMMSGIILNRSQPKFAAKTVANQMRCLKAMRRPALTIGFSIQRFFEQSATQINRLLPCWPTINNSISKSVLNTKFSVLVFMRSMSYLVSIQRKICEIKIFLLVQNSQDITAHVLCTAGQGRHYCTDTRCMMNWLFQSSL